MSVHADTLRIPMVFRQVAYLFTAAIVTFDFTLLQTFFWSQGGFEAGSFWEVSRGPFNNDVVEKEAGFG